MASASVPPPRAAVAVLGLGGIGGVIAGSLRAAGRHDVIACVRRPVERILLERPEGKVDLPLRALADPAAAEPVDWVLLCTKVHETPSAAPWLARLCRRSTRVAVLQNGIDHAARVGPLAKGAAIVPTIVYYNAERLGPGHVRLRHAGDYDLAVAEDALGRSFGALLDGVPLRLLLSPDLTTLLWRKLLMNAAVNPVTALTLQRQAVLRREDVRGLCMAVLDEAVAVARAAGARLAPDETARTMAAILEYPPEAGSSMYFDRAAGRPLEVEAINGAIVETGERHGVATPLNRALLALLRAISDAAARRPAKLV